MRKHAGLRISKRLGIDIGNLGDAGEMLDEQAKVAYRRRLSDLREEQEEAKELGNVERAEQAEQEIDALTSELSRTVGLRGRSRRAASASERARQSISKTRIAQSDARVAQDNPGKVRACRLSAARAISRWRESWTLAAVQEIFAAGPSLPIG